LKTTNVKNNNFSILVNSTDSFEDCWHPFFTLFSKYWPDCHAPIYLNTGKKEYSFKELEIICVKNSSSQIIHNTWSECLLIALNSIENDVVLYLQEDYFLKAPVNVDKISKLYRIMINENIDCIHLTPFASPGPFVKTKYEDLLELDKKASYRISTQAALWKKDVLISYLRKHESPWHFEIYGTKRAHRKNHKIFMINSDIYKEGIHEIIPYTPTGIVKGKWNKNAVEDLFKNNNLTIDYSQRGIYDSSEIAPTSILTFRKIYSRIKSMY
jgi:hypothetical protein